MTALSPAAAGPLGEVRRRARRSRPRSGGGITAMLDGSPWGEVELARLVKSSLLGAVGIAVAAFGANGATGWSRLMLWVAVGIGATLLGALGMARWLITGMATVRYERRLVLDAATRRVALARAERTPAAHEATFTAPGMSRRHRPTCELLAGKQATPLFPHEAGALEPCGVCGA